MASAHVPMVLDGRPFTSVRGRLYLDGSLQDFIVWDNSPLLKYAVALHSVALHSVALLSVTLANYPFL